MEEVLSQKLLLREGAQRTPLDRAAELLCALIVDRLAPPGCLTPLLPRDRLQVRAGGLLLGVPAPHRLRCQEPEHCHCPLQHAPRHASVQGQRRLAWAG